MTMSLNYSYFVPEHTLIFSNSQAKPRAMWAVQVTLKCRIPCPMALFWVSFFIQLYLLESLLPAQSL